MAQPTTSASVEDLIDRAADLKGELVAFAQSPRFRKWLDVLLRDATDDLGYLDEGRAVHVVDRFALQHRLPDGHTVVERFVAQRRPPLSDDERELVLGWGDVVEGCFEVRGADGEAVELEAQETLRECHRRLRSEAVARLKGKAARRARTAGCLPEDAGRLPEELLHADSVALIYDEIEGLGYYRDFGRLDALFADPTQVRDRADLRTAARLPG